MPKSLPKEVVDVLKKYQFDGTAVWDCHGTWVVYHSVLEKIAALEGIEFQQPHVASSDITNVAICVTGQMGDRFEWSFGEASPKNCKNSYPWAMAEKRAKDRVILKLIGLSGIVYSEEEADDFKRPEHKWNGPLGKTAIKEKLRNLNAEIEACGGDVDALDIVLADHAEIIQQCEVDLPDWYNPMQEKITQIRKEAEYVQ